MSVDGPIEGDRANKWQYITFERNSRHLPCVMQL